SLLQSCDDCCASIAAFEEVLPSREGPREVYREDVMRRMICTTAAAALAICAMSASASAQQGGGPTQQANAADPAANPDQELARRFPVKAEISPPPKREPIAASRSLVTYGQELITQRGVFGVITAFAE